MYIKAYLFYLYNIYYIYSLFSQIIHNLNHSLGAVPHHSWVWVGAGVIGRVGGAGEVAREGVWGRGVGGVWGRRADGTEKTCFRSLRVCTFLRAHGWRVIREMLQIL